MYRLSHLDAFCSKKAESLFERQSVNYFYGNICFLCLESYIANIANKYVLQAK